jgi:aspartyl-tRNA(Asn)/glutamyl-tRNA(Gln) amidotransferase subunit C
MKISRQDVLHVSELAHLELTEAEVEIYLRQLDSILTYVEKLNELDTAEVEPMAQVLSGGAGEENPALRDDTPVAQDVADAVLAGAPDPSKHYFRVPKVIER